MTSSQDFSSAVGGTPSTGGSPAGSHSLPAPPAGSAEPRPAGGPPSTADVAKDQASSVAGSASDSAKHVAGVAKDQAGQVTAEAGQQVRQLVGQAQSELSDQAQVQQEKLAGGLHSVGDQLKAMAQNSDQPGVATDLAHQAADKAHQLAGWLDERDPGSVVNEVRAFARKRPGMFLAVALGAGLVAGRLARGLAADPDQADHASTAGKPVAPGDAATPRAAQHLPAPATLAQTRPAGTVAAASDAAPAWAGRAATDLGGSR